MSKRRIIGLALAAVLVMAAGTLFAVSNPPVFKRISNLQAKGLLILDKGEYIFQSADDFIELQGAAGTDDTDITFDLDGTYPVISSPTDSKVGIDDDLEFVGNQTIDSTGTMSYTCTGACTLGDAGATSLNLTTDGTGDAEVVHPENSIGPDEVAVLHDSFVACGQQANNGTVYGGPALSSINGDGAEYALGGAACDALDNATEATADAPLGFANNAFKVTGMLCEVSSSGANGVTLTLRSAEANLTPSVTCTVATGETTCVSVTGSTTDVAAGATVAVQATNTEDLSLQDFWCRVGIAWKS